MKFDIKWIIAITIITFTTTILLSIGSQVLLNNIGFLVGLIIILLFIFIGIITDIIGVAVQSSNHEAFHAMASKKIKHANHAKKMLNNAPKVSSFFCDVIGDICNIISGSAGIIVATIISLKYNFNIALTNLIITSLIASLTIGGKAIGKSIAIYNSKKIVDKVTKFLNKFSRK